MNQIAFQFDRESVRRILKGFVHSLVVTVLLLAVDAFMELAGAAHFENPVVAGAYAYICQNLYNIAKEYVKGLPPKE